MEDVIDRVERGALLLDGIFPTWAHHINPQTLNLDGCEHCVLGQLDRCQGWRDVYEGTPTPIGVVTIRECGFDISLEGVSRGQAYQELRDAWIVEIQKRMGA